MTPQRAVLFAVLLTPLALLAMAKYVIVDVHEAGPNGTRIWMPVPLAVAQAVLRFAPEEAQRVRQTELAAYLPLLRSLTDEIKKVGDAELVRVEGEDEQVFVRKIDENLVIDVLTAEQEVRVRVPFEVLESLVDSHDGEYLHTSSVLSALRGASGDLVRVRDGETKIRIGVW